MKRLGRPRPTHTGCALLLFTWGGLITAALTIVGISR